MGQFFFLIYFICPHRIFRFFLNSSSSVIITLQYSTFKCTQNANPLILTIFLTDSGRCYFNLYDSKGEGIYVVRRCCFCPAWIMHTCNHSRKPIKSSSTLEFSVLWCFITNLHPATGYNLENQQTAIQR